MSAGLTPGARLATPGAKILLAVSDPWMLAGLLYLGSGVGLGAFAVVRRAQEPGGRAGRKTNVQR